MRRGQQAFQLMISSKRACFLSLRLRGIELMPKFNSFKPANSLCARKVNWIKKNELIKAALSNLNLGIDSNSLTFERKERNAANAIN